MTPSLIRSTMSRLSKDVTIKKFDRIINSLEKDPDTINKLQKAKEEYLFNFIENRGIKNRLWV